MNRELRVSFDVLKKVYMEGAYVSIELNRALDNAKGINSALVTKIVYGVLEKDITLEYFISSFVSKKPKDEFMILLKMVAYVSKSISSIPSFALVNEVVDIAKTIDRHQSGFVNAVSKKLIANKIVLPNKDKEYTKYLSIRYSYPEWVIKELLKKHDNKFVEALVSENLPTDTHIRIVTSKISSSDFKAKLNTLGIRYSESLFDDTLYVDYGALIKTNLNNFAVVQGLPSIITSKVLGANSGLVLDTCSAPGGKAIYIASNSKSEVYACDIHPHRVELIKKYALSQGVNNIKCFVCDATKEKKEWLEKFDFVMCDVPCSNLGVSRKKPDVFLNKTLSDVKTLAGLQYQILSNSAKYVKHGGILQYSTCTILDNENKGVIDKFLKNNPEFELTSIDTFGLNIVNDNNLYTFYPNLTHTEGFFIGRLRRK